MPRFFWIFFQLTGLRQVLILIALEFPSQGAVPTLRLALCAYVKTTAARFDRSAAVLKTTLKTTQQRVKGLAFLPFNICHSATLLSLNKDS